MKRLVMLIAMLAMTAMLAVPALAQGQVERGPAHAKSICSFSGLNDDPTDPEDPGRVQSYGRIVKAGARRSPRVRASCATGTVSHTPRPSQKKHPRAGLEN